MTTKIILNHSLGKQSRRQIDDIFPFFPPEDRLWRFAWKDKTYFLGKIRKRRKKKKKNNKNITK